MGKVLVGNHIRKLRFNHNEMTQQQLADKVGVTRQTIVALEKGRPIPCKTVQWSLKAQKSNDIGV
ncbi:helix-turn-helix transcriptional regulator [Paenibacillus methanolicus]|uniref:Putative transcriptional regulator n=1 Tax=Paenibacillus methanolicus TaxID=582686 RepID=A0A5S5CJA3_9BACL|nr:helix-turn-helix domain-containing protein [Paenibacillus methanolicus]TYP78276.1 putative transcriptional regulator [Paenibacillus methanolicus]